MKGTAVHSMRTVSIDQSGTQMPFLNFWLILFYGRPQLGFSFLVSQKVYAICTQPFLNNDVAHSIYSWYTINENRSRGCAQ